MSPRRPKAPKIRPPDPDAVDTSMRLFLAVTPPPAVPEAASRLIADLEREHWPIRWVDPESVHITLHFLGETPRERAQLLRLALPAVVAPHAPFDLRTGDLGVFPNIRHPRVLWWGVYGPAHRLITLEEAIGKALRDLEFPVDEAPFHPHLTLGRVRNQGTPQVPLRTLPEAMRHRLANPENGVMAGPPTLPIPVTEVVLVRSVLSHEGARYEPWARFPLVGEGAAKPAGGQQTPGA